ncbi:MAG: motility associated factor glycosyltransferase family protein [Succinivibrio sp.]|nr:motility associated factor glycosyltransferase family protein [Succinivibrio sp.]
MLKPGLLTKQEIGELSNFAPDGLDLLSRANTLFERNLEALQQFSPDIYNSAKDYRPKHDLVLFSGENGELNLCVSKSGADTGEVFYHAASPREFCLKQLESTLSLSVGRIRFAGSDDHLGQIHLRYLNEACNINQEHATDALSAEQLHEVPAVIVAGLGLGYVLEHLSERLSCSLLILLEPEMDFFFASLYCIDWKILLDKINGRGCNVCLQVGLEAADMYENLQAQFWQHGRFLAGSHWFLQHYHSKAADEVVEQLRQNFGYICDGLGFYDDQLFGISHLCHAIENGHKFIRSDLDLPQSFLDLPLCLIGNGPSLDRDLPFLRKYQDELVIVACGSALDTLYHAGIKPDFFAVTERTPDQASFVSLIPDRDFVRSLILIASDVAHPDLLKFFDTTALFGKSNEAGYWMLRDCDAQSSLVRQIGVMNPTVGNLGVAASVALKFKNVYLFGMDYGKPIGGQIHSSYSTLYEQRDADEDRQYTFDETVKGNFGGKFELGGIFKLGRHNLEYEIAQGNAQNQKFHNCSDGALMRGAIPLRSSALASRLKKRHSTVHKSELIRFFRERMLIRLDLDRTNLLKTLNHNTFSSLCTYLISLWTKPLSERVEYVRRMSLTIEILNGLRQPLPQSVPTFMGIMLRGTAESIFLCAEYALYGEEDPQAGMSRASRIIKRWTYFLEDAAQLYSLLPDFICGDIARTKLHGKVGFDHPDSPAPDLPALLSLTNKDYDDPQKTFEKRYK